MLIEDKLLELTKAIPEVPYYLKEKTKYRLDTEAPKQRKPFKVKRLVFQVLGVLILALVITFSSVRLTGNYSVSEGYGSGIGPGAGGEVSFHGYAALSTDKAKYDLNNPTRVSFNYGHNISQNDPNVIGYRLEVFTFSKGYLNQFHDDPIPDYYLLYELDFTKEEFLTEENKIANKGNLWIWSRIKYKQGFDLLIDFTNIGYDTGKLAIRITEYAYHYESDNPDGHLEKGFRYSILSFEKKNNTIYFSK